MLTKKYSDSQTFTNEYDEKGRISSSSYGETTVNYAYDTHGQLVSANDDTYDYDDRGNITSKTVGDITTTFTYNTDGWKDLLVKVNDDKLTYDANGNVLTYGDKEFTWSYGRTLTGITDSENEYSYTYDENGIRTSKTVNGSTTYYNTDNGTILSQSNGDNTWYFQYDTNGLPLGFVLNDTQYFYITNQMGDILAITDTDGNVVGNYEYDAWGKVLTADTDIAKQNPLRYRGYYYDNETGYYYLQSRYYDSNICRFINADKCLYISNTYFGINAFQYCNNNSICYIDINGTVPMTVNLNHYKATNVVMKFVKKVFSQVTFDKKVYSKKYKYGSKMGCELYIGASAGATISIMKNNVSKSNSGVKISTKCTFKFGKYKNGWSNSFEINGYTVKYAFVIGVKSVAIALKIISKLCLPANYSAYFSFDMGINISQKIIKGAKIVTAAASVCFFAPSIVSLVSGIMTDMSTVLTYKALTKLIGGIAKKGLSIAAKLA